MAIQAASANGKASRKAYETLETLGCGSQGSVKLARHRASGRLCAIKAVCKPDDSGSDVDGYSSSGSGSGLERMSTGFEAVREAVVTEARVLAQMAGHRAVPELYEVIESESKYYIVMEHIEGQVSSSRGRFSGPS